MQVALLTPCCLGAQCLDSDAELQPYIYSPMSLLLQNTILRRWDGTRIWFPNLKLQTTPLLNLSRSDSKVEIFKVSNLIASHGCS